MRCGIGKVITYSECVYVALVIEQALCKHCTATCGLPSLAIFFHIIL